jgi:hypothetical protein
MSPRFTFHQLKKGEGLLNILFKVLDEDNSFSFQQAVETVFSSIDFQKAIDDKDEEDNSREDRQIDWREAPFYLIFSIREQNTSPPYYYGGVLLGNMNPIGLGPCLIRWRRGNSCSGHQILSHFWVRRFITFPI